MLHWLYPKEMVKIDTTTPVHALERRSRNTDHRNTLPRSLLSSLLHKVALSF